MSIASGDLRVYSSLNPAWQDNITIGGGINTGVLVLFDSATYANSPCPNNSGISIKSSWAGDAGGGQVLVSGRNSAGSIISELITLSGTNVSSGVNGIGGNGSLGVSYAYDRIINIFCSTSAHSGTVNVYAADGTIIADLPSGVSGVMRPFMNTASQANSPTIYYDKVFIKNNNNVNALLSAYVSYVSNTLSNNVSFGLDTVQNGTLTSTNRQTAPVGITSGNPSASGVPGTDLGVGSGIGVWLFLSLAQNQAAAKGVYTVSISGSTT